jgi:hypothetical protein
MLKAGHSEWSLTCSIRPSRHVRLIVVATLSGDSHEAAAIANQFREGWNQAGPTCAGRPRAEYRSRAPYAGRHCPWAAGTRAARRVAEHRQHVGVPGTAPGGIHFHDSFGARLLHRGSAPSISGLDPRSWHSRRVAKGYGSLDTLLVQKAPCALPVKVVKRDSLHPCLRSPESAQGSNGFDPRPSDASGNAITFKNAGLVCPFRCL